jgi:hypothetical protein
VLAGRLASEQADLNGEIAVLRVTLDTRRRAEVVALVNSAIKGHEDGRKAIEDFCTATPLAFPAGFPEAIADARFDRLALKELATILEK